MRSAPRIARARWMRENDRPVCREGARAHSRRAPHAIIWNVSCASQPGAPDRQTTTPFAILPRGVGGAPRAIIWNVSCASQPGAPDRRTTTPFAILPRVAWVAHLAQDRLGDHADVHVPRERLARVRHDDRVLDGEGCLVVEPGRAARRRGRSTRHIELGDERPGGNVRQHRPRQKHDRSAAASWFDAFRGRCAHRQRLACRLVLSLLRRCDSAPL